MALSELRTVLRLVICCRSSRLLYNEPLLFLRRQQFALFGILLPFLHALCASAADPMCPVCRA
eukprot:6212273-Pleurochrysis_carterae.AAC.7